MKFFLIVLGFSIWLSNVNACPIVGNVEKIVDGDTIHVNNAATDETFKIRFLGIDAPELHFYGKSQGRFAEEAKEFLEETIPVGTKVRVECDQEEIDKYGRTLGHVFKGRTNINLQLLKNGLAVDYIIYPNLKYLNEYANATREAIKNEVGIWSVPDYELPYEFRLSTRGGKPAKWVCCRSTKKCLDPEEYIEIKIPDRIFFMRKGDTKKFGK